MREGKCDLCDKVFEMTRSDKKYCAATCRAKASQKRAKARKRKLNFINANRELIQAFKLEFETFKTSLTAVDPATIRDRINQYWSGAIQISQAVGNITTWDGLVDFFDFLDIPDAYRLSKQSYDRITATKKGLIARTIDYARLTFILSFVGFLGSIGFYFGVLREVYSPARDKQKIEVLEEQNAAMQNTVNILIQQEKSGE